MTIDSLLAVESRPTVLTVFCITVAMLILAVVWRYMSVLLNGDRMPDVTAAVPAAGMALSGGWSHTAIVTCPHCGVENDIESVYCTGCRTQLSTEWAMDLL